MSRILLKKSLILALIAVLAAVFIPVAVNAITGNFQNQEEVRINNIQKRVEEIKEKREAIQTKLEEKKLVSCQKREQSINNIMTRIGDRGNKQMGVFTKIYERVKIFYDEKGNSLENYDLLVQDVDAAKFNVEAAVERVRNMSGTFKCGSEDPKGDSLVFKEYQNEQNDTLKVYRTAIKELIVGVKSVQSQTGDQ